MDMESKQGKELQDIISSLDFIKPDDIPSIELYMDQVTTFMERHLEHNKRNDEDKIMTKTMINNYTKNNLLPPPNKKRYTKEHLILLIYIYYLKNLLSISDIQALLEPMIEHHYQPNDRKALNIDEIYKGLYDYQHNHFDDVIENIATACDRAAELYQPEKNKYMYNMSLVSLLSFDVYIKKKYIEHLIDDMHKEKSKKQASAEREKAKAKAKEKASDKTSEKIAEKEKNKKAEKPSDI